MRVAVVGSSGFVGSAVAASCKAMGYMLVSLAAPRLVAESSTFSGLRRELGGYQGLVEQLAVSLAGSDAVVNAAGCAKATSRDSAALVGANGLVPALLAEASSAAGIRRFVHVSSAAVQGRRPVIDESQEYDPFTPYARSKILGELAVLELGGPGAVVYRPTSVHGASRSVSRSVARFARSRLSSVAGDGKQPTPQILVTSVGSAVRFLIETDASPSIVMHPWEGLTTASLLRLLGDGRTPKHLPAPLAKSLLSGLTGAARLRSGAQGVARRLEMVWFGQEQGASWLTGAGWTGPATHDDWIELGRTLAEGQVTRRRRRWPSRCRQPH